MKPQFVAKQTQRQRKNELYQVINHLHCRTEVQKFMEDLCTPAELQAMADRWQVVKLLAQQQSYRTIHHHSNVSLTTISRVARAMHQPQSGYVLALKKEQVSDNHNAIREKS